VATEGSLDSHTTSERLRDDPSSYEPTARKAMTPVVPILEARGEMATAMRLVGWLELLHPTNSKRTQNRTQYEQPRNLNSPLRPPLLEERGC